MQGTDKYLLTCFGGWVDATADVEWCSSSPWYRAARDHLIFLRRDRGEREGEGKREGGREGGREAKCKGEIESEEKVKLLP